MNLRLAVKSPKLFVCMLAAACCLLATESKPDESDKAATPAADSMFGKEAGQERNDNGLKMKLVWCPPGTFTMGRQQDTKYQVEVTLTKGLWLGKYEVTQQEYQRIMGKNPSYFSAQGEGKKDVSGQDTARFPVEQVSWDASVEFCRKLTDQERKAGRLPTGWDYTLPTEAQWEYACRAGTTTKYSFGDKLSDRKANVAGDQDWALGGGGPDGVDLAPTTTTVGSYSANKWGLCDMHGNAWEWCRDWYAADLPGGTDPEVASQSPGQSPGQSRDYRGGGWVCNAYDCHSAFRRGNRPEYRYRYLGFRVALSPFSR